MILAGDIGGTNARLALFEGVGGELVMRAHGSYRAHEFQSLEEIVRLFLAANPGKIEAACLGVAGPVMKNRVIATNLAWQVDGAALRRALNLPPVALLNDLVAYAYGALAMPPSQLVTLQAGAPVVGNRALIAAGTGLGVGGLLWHGGKLLPVPTEGGHADFAAIDDIGIELYRYLRGKFGHVSFERVLSGPGLQNVYEFLRDTHRAEEPAELAQALSSTADVPAAISRFGISEQYAICEQALELFCRYYGACAGNVALNFIATAGLYVGGGIAIRTLAKPKLQAVFLETFTSKGRLSPVVRAIPVMLIENEDAGLIGAAHAAAATQITKQIRN
ncbi:MAG TPA: glucokinase [Terriglobales bacterium]|nr:glucokinase [Terriglobales bacterium]